MEQPLSQREKIEERLNEVREWLKDMPESVEIKTEERELETSIESITLHESLDKLSAELARAESAKDSKKIESLTQEISQAHKRLTALEERKKLM